MDDLINRQAAIDAIGELCSCTLEEEARWREIIGSIPSAQQEQRWIPVSERLPEKNGRYLVTNTRWGAYELDWDIFYKEQNDWLFGKDVTAWMPLPEPYKEEGS